MKDVTTAENSDQVPDLDQVLEWLLLKRKYVTAYARMILKDVQLAEDIFQEVCVEVIRKKKEFNNEEAVVRWALAVSRNKAVDEVRRRSRHATVFSDEVLVMLADDLVDIGESGSGERSQPVKLKKCMQTLTPKMRELLYLRYNREKKPADIAKLFGQNIQAVYKSITRVHAALRVCMQSRTNEI